MKRKTTRTILLALLAFALLLPATVLASDVYTDNVVILLDGSGSMEQKMAGGVSRMNAAKQALHAVLANLPPSTHVGLLVFSAKGVQDDWVYPLGPRDDAKLNAAIDAPQPGGGTPLGAYLKIAVDRLLAERGQQMGYGTYRLLVVTDGEAHDPQLVDQHVAEIVARGITVDAIGVDMKQDHTLATKVHSYRRADDPESLTKAVSEVFAEVGGTASDDAAVDFSLLEGFPGEVAGAAVSTLVRTGNQPIGVQPGQTATASTTGSVPGTPAGSGSSSGKKEGFNWITALIIFIIIFSILPGKKEKKRK